jgi:signal transduction histidine kinase
MDQKNGSAPEAIPIDDARTATNEKLAREREEADQALRAKLVAARRRNEEAIGRTKREVDRTLRSVEKEAVRVVAEPTAETSELEQTLDGDESQRAEEVAAKARVAVNAEKEKAQAAAMLVAERAEEAIAAERARVAEATQRERAERKRAFMEILNQERKETDTALGLERRTSDVLVRGRDEVLAMISHDLRNLIQGISLKSSLLQRVLSGRASGDPESIAVQISRACEVMTRWSGDLVDIASLNAGVLELERKMWKRGEVVNDAVQAVHVQATEKGIQLAVRIPEPNRPFFADRDRIVQVLINLLHNAVKFTPPRGTITVRVEQLETDVRFSVSDSGPGISEEDRPNIFEHRWHAASGRGGGAGLGLYICRRVIEWHGGRIGVESAPGRGSTFFFTLPA